jgi:hypothetical protein
MAAIAGGTGAPHARIMGVGAYRPTRLVPNSEVVDAIDSSDEWIQQRSGIKTRRWAGPEESVQMMSVEASRIAIERSGLDVGQIDCVVVATVSHLLQTPAVATAVAHELGTDGAAAFDISAACSGFCHGIALASDIVRAGSADGIIFALIGRALLGRAGRGERTGQSEHDDALAGEQVTGVDVLPAERVGSADAFVADAGLQYDIGNLAAEHGDLLLCQAGSMVGH